AGAWTTPLQWCIGKEPRPAEKRFQACTELIEAGQETPRNLANAHYNRGAHHAAARDEARALEEFNKSIEIDPTFGPAYRGRGAIFSRQGDNVRAIANLDEAIRLDPEDGLAFLARARAYADIRQTDRAIDDYNAAIRINPTSVASFYGRGL